ISDLLASQLTVAPGRVDTLVQRALAAIGADLDVDRVVFAERDADRRTVRVAHSWAREGVAAVPVSVAWREFPWSSARLGAGHADRGGDRPRDGGALPPPASRADARTARQHAGRAQRLAGPRDQSAAVGHPGERPRDERAAGPRAWRAGDDERGAGRHRRG